MWMITTTEQQKINPEELEGINLDLLRRCVNYDTSKFVHSSVNLIRYEFSPAESRDGFYSFFRIGAEWLDVEQTKSIVVIPKVKNIDFIEIFMNCLRDNEEWDNFEAVYDIDFNARPVRSKALCSILSPLLVVQFLLVVKKITNRGLRKGYVSRKENLMKVKGRLNIRRTERNAMLGHREQMNCTYDEFSADTPENRFIKKALYVAHDMISLMHGHKSYDMISAMCNHCMSAFSEVSDDENRQPPAPKSNNLYHEYSDALRFAKMILRYQDLAINRYNYMDMDVVPVFRIDMALLFEHYALSLLRRTFGKSSIMYQVKGYGGRFIADFLIAKGCLKAIIDTKYVDSESNNVAIPQYVKQLSAYARDKVLLKALGIHTSDEESIPVVPCVILYPALTTSELTAGSILSYPVKQTLKFYTYPIQIPTYRLPEFGLSGN